MSRLDEARKIIDSADTGMRELFLARMEAVRQIGEYKTAAGMKITDSKREQEIIERNAALIEDPALRFYYVSFLKNNIELAKKYQRHMMTGTPGRKNLVLIGMPGSGKTTIGMQLAKRLDVEFADVDFEIIKRIKMSVSEYFAAYGEEAFRDLESEVIRELASGNSTVIATGGGSVLRKENMEALKKNGILYFINRPMDFLAVSTERPLTTNRALLEEQYAERQGMYMKECDRMIEAVSDVEANVKDILDDFGGRI